MRTSTANPVYGNCIAHADMAPTLQYESMFGWTCVMILPIRHLRRALCPACKRLENLIGEFRMGETYRYRETTVRRAVGFERQPGPGLV